MTTPATTTRTLGDVTIPQAGRFNLDPAHTAVGFVVRHLVVSKVRGSFGEVSGVITLAEEPLDSAVEVTIVAASINTGAPDRDNHARSSDFLDLENHPNITFRSTKVTQRKGAEFIMVGDLSIRGVTREVEIEVEFDGTVISPSGQEVVAFTATTEIDREDFGIMWNQALEAGGVMVSKKVKIEITAEAIRA